MSYFSTGGFLFAVASCPELVRPSEWFPVIFDDKEIVYETFEDAEKVSTALLGLYNLINEQVLAGDPQLPPGCVLHKDPLANLEEGAGLSDWCWGFADGHRWLSKVWKEAVPEDLENEFTALLMVFHFFLGRPAAEKLWKESKRQDMTLEEMVAGVLEQLGEAMRGYAAMGMALTGRVSGKGPPGAGPAPAVKTGRNEPCPCGSGKKYKKCCLDSDTGGGNGNGSQEVGGNGEDSWQGFDLHSDTIFRERVQETFAGFMPQQVNDLLNDPFDSGSPAVIDTELAIEAEVPFLGLFMPLIRELGEGPLKETGTGNLPRKVVRAVARDFFGGSYEIVRRLHADFHSENHFMELHVVRHVAMMGGFVKKKYQRFSLTKRGESVLEDGISGEVFLRLVKTYTRKFNWGYRDGYPELPVVQAAAFFALHLLQQFGDEDHPLSFYADRFLAAFPTAVKEFPERDYMSREDTVRQCFKIRAMERFAHFFGFMEYAERKPGRLIRDDEVVRKTPFLDDWISFRLD